MRPIFCIIYQHQIKEKCNIVLRTSVTFLYMKINFESRPHLMVQIKR